MTDDYIGIIFLVLFAFGAIIALFAIITTAIYLREISKGGKK